MASASTNRSLRRIRVARAVMFWARTQTPLTDRASVAPRSNWAIAPASSLSTRRSPSAYAAHQRVGPELFDHSRLDFAFGRRNLGVELPLASAGSGRTRAHPSRTELLPLSRDR